MSRLSPSFSLPLPPSLSLPLTPLPLFPLLPFPPLPVATIESPFPSSLQSTETLGRAGRSRFEMGLERGPTSDWLPSWTQSVHADHSRWCNSPPHSQTRQGRWRRCREGRWAGSSSSTANGAEMRKVKKFNDTVTEFRGQPGEVGVHSMIQTVSC